MSESGPTLPRLQVKSPGSEGRSTQTRARAVYVPSNKQQQQQQQQQDNNQAATLTLPSPNSKQNGQSSPRRESKPQHSSPDPLASPRSQKMRSILSPPPAATSNSRSQTLKSPRAAGGGMVSPRGGPSVTVQSTATLPHMGASHRFLPVAPPKATPVSVTAQENSVVFVPAATALVRKRVHLLRSKPFLHSRLQAGSYYSYHHVALATAQPAPAALSPPARSTGVTYADDPHYNLPEVQPGPKHTLAAQRPHHMYSGSAATATGEGGEETKQEGGQHIDAGATGGNSAAVAERLRQHQHQDEERRADYEAIVHTHSGASTLVHRVLQALLVKHESSKKNKRPSPFAAQGSDSHHVLAHEAALVLVSPSALYFDDVGTPLAFTVTNTQESIMGLKFDSANLRYSLEGGHSTETIYLAPAQSKQINVYPDWSQIESDRQADQQEIQRVVDENTESQGKHEDQFGTGPDAPPFHPQPLPRARSEWCLHAGAISMQVQPLTKTFAVAPTIKAHQHSLITLTRVDTKPEPWDEIPLPVFVEAPSKASLTAAPQSPPRRKIGVNQKPIPKPKQSPYSATTAATTSQQTPRENPRKAILMEHEAGGHNPIAGEEKTNNQHHLQKQKGDELPPPVVESPKATATMQSVLTESKDDGSSSLSPTASAENLSPNSASNRPKTLSELKMLRQEQARAHLSAVDTHYGAEDPHLVALYEQVDVSRVPYSVLPEPYEASLLVGLQSPFPESDPSFTRNPDLEWTSSAELRAMDRISQLSLPIRCAEHNVAYRRNRMVFERMAERVETHKAEQAKIAEFAQQKQQPQYQQYSSNSHSTVTTTTTTTTTSSSQSGNVAHHSPQLQQAVFDRISRLTRHSRLVEEAHYRVDGVERLVDVRLNELDKWKAKGHKHEPSFGLAEEADTVYSAVM